MPAEDTFLNCAACRFWDHKGTLVGLCRRHAPASSEREFEVVRWPETRSLDGCGEGETTSPGGPAVLAPACGDCVFWSRPGLGINLARRGDRGRDWWDKAGFCRRFSPRPGVDIGDHAFWRITNATDHCADGRRA